LSSTWFAIKINWVQIAGFRFWLFAFQIESRKANTIPGIMPVSAPWVNINSNYPIPGRTFYQSIQVNEFSIVWFGS
jgi:hypothetical protein